VESRRALSFRLLIGLAVTLSAVGVYFTYTIFQIRGLRALQADIIDRNRTDSLLLLRIQNNLNSLGLAMRDMLDSSEPYPLTAWRSQFHRIRVDLEDAVEREAHFAPATRTSDQARYLASQMAQFWDALERTFALAEKDEQEARTQIRLSLQARQAALGTAVARLLVENNESEQQAAAQIQRIYARVERNVYLFLGAMLIVVAVTSAYLLHYNRRVFDQVTTLSQRRSELAQQLISMQENTFRHISRELHDEFGQILTAVGAILQRAQKRLDPRDEAARAELREVREIVQSALEKVRALSHALHPVVLEEMGLESALDTYLPMFQQRTGITIRYEKAGASRPVDREAAIHLYRVLQEALNNVVRHSQSKEVHVRLRTSPSALILEVEDFGVGFQQGTRQGMGLISMRERAELVNGTVEFLAGASGGALVRMSVPLEPEEVHAGNAV
jgi:signal transduction histidine kinase